MMLTVAASAQTLYTYDNAETGAPGTVATGVSASNLVGVNGVTTFAACPDGYITRDWPTATGAFVTTYGAVQVTITPTLGYSVTFSSMSFDFGRNPQGPERVRFAYSTNGGLTWTNNGADFTITSGPCGAATTFNWDFADFTASSPVLFRVYGWNASNTNGQGRAYNGVINGTACLLQTFYADADGDGYGNAAVTTTACTAPTGFVADNTDCNDANSGVNPGAAEICNDLDENCNGLIDEGIPTSTWYGDADGDGFGDAAVSVVDCAAPAGYVADNTDCNDADNGTYPGATEVCDGADNDCDGSTDEDLITAVMTPVGDVFTCKGEPFTWAVEECAGCTYQWFKNDNILPGATNATYSTTKPAYYNVQVTIPGGCFDVSEYSLLTTLLNPNANIYNPNGLNLCAPTPGTNIILKVGYTATNTYQWYKDGAPYAGTGATEWRIFPTEPGDYYCSITAASGCNRITETRTVINSCRMSAVTAPASVEVYPNPASDMFTVAMNLEGMDGDATLQMVNITGQVVYANTVRFVGGILEETLQVQDIASGIYVVRVVANGQAFDTRMVIE